MSASTTSSVAPTLRRALGRWDLTAIGVNQVIGGAIFLMPSQLVHPVTVKTNRFARLRPTSSTR